MFNKKSHIHFVGIGGIGMSGIATILHHQGYSISGCDKDITQSSIDPLQKLGCLIHAGNNTPLCHDPSIDIMVYSSAVKKDNPELVWAQSRGIPTISRAIMLAEIMRTKYSIAIAGSHGKTTTTSLISHILIQAAYDPTVIIGGHLKSISHNARLGKGDFLVAEADESDRSFLHLQATIAIVTNIDLEHLETYTDITDIKNTFIQFLNNLPFYGRAILCIDDPHVQSILPLPHIKTILYGLSVNAHFHAKAVRLEASSSHFEVFYNKDFLGLIDLAIPGKHNVLNALAAIAVCRQLEIPFETIAQGLSSFSGVDRRFSYRGTTQGAEIFDDYGHHPAEIACTLDVARRRTKNKLIVVFQPHRYTRTHHLWNDFVSVLGDSTIDHLIITDIYAASEAPIDGVTATALAYSIATAFPHKSVSYVPFSSDFDLIARACKEHTQEGNLILLLGAGKITQLSKILL